MPTNGTLVVTGTGDEAKFIHNHTTAQTDIENGYKVTFTTKNHFVDKDIEIDITTPEASGLALDVTDSSSALDMGEATGGVYSPTATISGNASVTSAGWLSTGNHAVSESGVVVGKVNQSVLKNGTTVIASGAEIVPHVSNDQTINITEGYNVARTVVVAPMEDGQAATVSSSNATVSNLTFTAANDAFTISGSETIAAPTVSQPGFISSTKGTKNTGTATVSATVDEVTVGVTVSGTAKVTPVISRASADTGDTYVEAGTGTATTTKPNSGAYVRIKSAAASNTISSVGKVTAAGYGTPTDYTAADPTTTEVGANASADTFVQVAAGAVTSGTAEIDTVTVEYNSTAGNFDVSGSANIPAPTVSTAGYVGNGVGTATGATGGATVDASLAKIGITAAITAPTGLKPVISKNAATNISADAATTTQPASGYYIAVDTAALSGTATATASVTSAGYGTTTAGQYTATGDSETVNVAGADTTYIPISGAGFYNEEQSGHTYSDISSSAPALISGSYLFINKGYTGDVKISLAKLVPDAASAGLAAGHILAGYSAYNNDGTLINGTIPTYDGSYVVG